MKVHIPSPLRSYTQRRDVVDAKGETVAELLLDLNRQFPGIRFRMVDEQDGIRRHMRIFVSGEEISNIGQSLQASDEIHILQALSGG
jgi:molybdopterin converting factor small subunit